ncbi:cytochrome P450 [Rhizophagus diaphanus]|nr:cytochrome P450 [Rhizophagus diaphanus] [Rhizophagus sp. MUCL 43196]
MDYHFSNGDRTYRKLATPAFNSALSPEMVGETTLDLISFIQQNLNRPIDVFEIMQRTKIEVLGKLAFGYKFDRNEIKKNPLKGHDLLTSHDTTSMSLNVSLYYLAKYPEMQEKAREEVISVLGNYPNTIPNSDQLKKIKGTSQDWKTYFANKHHSHNIPFAWIPFSAGPRNCMGQKFSLMEQLVIISMLLLKYNWTLPNNIINKDKLLLAPRFLLRPVDLKLIFTERIN